ncbi:MAG: tetratricopeptide repeat protein [Bacteroidota bacterium]
MLARYFMFNLLLLSFCPSFGQDGKMAVSLIHQSYEDSLRNDLYLHPKNFQTIELLSRFYLQVRPDTALKYANKLLEYAQTNENSELAGKGHFLLGSILKDFGVYSGAANHYFQAILAFKESGLSTELGMAHNGLGDLYYYTRDEEKALEQHHKALAIAREKNLPSLEAMTLGYLGHFYEKQEEYDKASSYQLLALEKYEQLMDPEGLSTINGYLGSIYEDLEDFEKAYHYFSQALTYNLETNNQEERIIHLNDIGDTFRKRGMYEDALLYTSQSLALAEELNNLYQVKSGKRDLAKTYAEMGDFEKAHDYLVEAYDLHEELFDAEEASQIARLQSLNEINQTQQELELLKRDKQLVQISLIALVAGLSLLLILSWLIVSRQRLKTQKDRELLEAKQALTEQELENSRLKADQLESDLEASSNQLGTHALTIVQKNKILKDIKTRLTHLKTEEKSLQRPISMLIKKIDEGFKFDKDWQKFNQIFEQVHPAFYRRLHEKYPDLTASEIRLCALLRLNLDSKDMATILGISQDSLRVARYRLRKKMDVEKGSNLISFVMNI